jgi:site-specific DNA-methyltransferase (adenine-specific)
MRAMDAESVHAIVSDPPYGLGFMGKSWDRGVPGVEFWREALRVAKPGAYLVAFSGSRTQHRLTCAIEDAGWEIRDCLMWLYGSGFPKSHDISKAIDRHLGAERRVIGVARGAGSSNTESLGAFARDYPATVPATVWDGFGTALKPAYEPIILARKPMGSTVAACVLEHGTGAININGCRIPYASEKDKAAAAATTVAQRLCHDQSAGCRVYHDFKNAAASVAPYLESMQGGRWPANVLLGCACEVEHDAGCAVAMLDAQSSVSLSSGGASRFFYTAKASAAERNAGLEHMRAVSPAEITGRAEGSPGLVNPRSGIGLGKRPNYHPTVKPVSIMRWLVRLVGGKPGNVVLDPFMGSGTTGVACAREGFDFVGIDLDPGHVEIARGRIAHASKEAAPEQAPAPPVPSVQGSQLNLLGAQL